MPDNTSSSKATEPEKKPQRGHDDDVVGKVYDRHLAGRLVRYLRPYKLQVVVSTLCTLLKASADVSGPFWVMTAVDTYLDPTGHPNWLARHLSPVATTGIAELGFLYLAALSLSLGLEFLQQYMMQWTGQQIMFDLRKEIFRHIQRLHIAFFDRNPVGRLVTRVTSDVDALNEMFTSGVLAIFEDVFTLTYIVIIMLRMSWPLALLTLAVLPLIGYATKLFRNHVSDSYRRQRAATAKINSFTQEYVTGMSIVQLFNRERRAYADFAEVNHENKLAWTDAIFAYALYYPVVEFLSSIAIALVLWQGGLAILRNIAIHAGAPSVAALGAPSVAAHFAATGGPATSHTLFASVTLGVLIAFIQYAQRFFRPIMDLSDKYNILQAAMAAAERVFKLLDTGTEIQQPALPTPGTKSGRIEFRHVWFTYQPLTDEQQATVASLPRGFSPDRSSSGLQVAESVMQNNSASAPDSPEALLGRGFSPAVPPTAQSEGASAPEGMPPILRDIEWILRDVSFTIEPDTTAAIVGHTGAGKTTITALMMRFYDVQSGQVLVDDTDVREQDLTALRRRFGVVLQDPFLFSGTVAANIRLGSHWITDDEVAHAAEQVNVADFIRTLPAQFAEPVLERGSTLSTGQKQLISFARALAHKPGILILDEATSSVDTETELRVRSALERMITGRTSVLIAHRLSTVQRADTILVMHKGQLREQGSHQELLAHRGLYYKLYRLQYKDQELAAAD